MKKIFTALAVACAMLAAPLSYADTAASTKPAVKKPVKKVVRKTSKKEAHPKAVDVISGKKIPLSEDNDDESSEPDTAGTTTYEYNCELGNKITIYRNEGDDKFIAMRWDKHLRRLRRVATTTGANRFENHLAGLVWISIPAKSMLLDSKKGQQLANECNLVKTTPATVAPVAPQK